MSLAALLQYTHGTAEDEDQGTAQSSPRAGGLPVKGSALAALLTATSEAEPMPAKPPTLPSRTKSPLNQLLSTTAQESQQPGALEGIANTARRGIRSAGLSIDAATAVGAAGLAADAAREPERIAELRRSDPAPRPENFVRYGDRAADVYAISRRKWEDREAERAERLNNNARFVEAQRAETVPALVSAMGRRQTEIEAIPRSAAMQQWDQAEGAGETLRALASNPIEVLANLAVEGVTSGAPALALGAAGSAAGPAGTIAGAGIGSFMTEYGGKIVAELQSMGADFNQPQTVAAVLNDPEKVAALREKALRRGVPVALIDAVSAGIAGKLVAKPGQAIGQRLLSGAKEIGTQAGLGAAGEVAGSVAAGDAVDFKSVLGEALGEVGGGSVEIATGAARRVLGGETEAETRGGARGTNDTGSNVAESVATLKAQQEQLLNGQRPAQMFPLGSPELPLPEGMKRIETPRGVFHFDPRAITAAEIVSASSNARENDVLALGKYNKADVMERAAEGESLVAVTERTPDGLEVKTAASTDALAGETAAELERTKTPGNVVAVEPVDRSVRERLNSQEQEKRSLKREQRQQELAQKRERFDERIAIAREIIQRPAVTFPEVNGALQSIAFYAEDNFPGLTAEQRKTAVRAYAALSQRAEALRAGDDAQRAASRVRQQAAAVDDAAAQKLRLAAEQARLKAEAAAGVGASGAFEYKAAPVRILEERAKRGDESAVNEIARRAEVEAVAGDRGETLLDALRAVPLPLNDSALGDELRSVLFDEMTGAQRKRLMSPKAQSLDRVAEGLRERGFNQIQTPADVIDFTTRALRGETVYPAGIVEDVPYATARTDLPASTAPGLSEADAERELATIRQAFPSLTRDYDIEIGLVRDVVEQSTARGQVSEQVQGAVLRTKAQRLLIVLSARSYRDRAKGAALLTHEIAHPYWDTLPASTKAELRALHAQEVSQKTGPLYQAGELQSELAYVEDMNERGHKEWFAERIARVNEAWAKDQLDRSESSLLRRLAHQLREFVRQVWEQLAGREGVDPQSELFTTEFRRFFASGSRAATNRRAAALTARPPGVIDLSTRRRNATDSPTGDAATRAKLIERLKRARAMRDEGIRAGDAKAEAEGVRATKAAREELELRFPDWDQPEVSPDDVENTPAVAAERLRHARQRLTARPDTDFREDITEPVARDLEIIADLREVAEQSRRESEDFVAFADRLRLDLGERITAYLPAAWDSVSGGRPIRDIYVSDNPLKVDEAWKRAVSFGRLFFEGAADVLRRNKFTALADAIERHVDLGDRNFAAAWSIIGPSVAKYQGLTGLPRRARANRVLGQWSDYYRARENKQRSEAAAILAKADEETKQLIEATSQLFEFTSYQNERLGIHVYDSTTQETRRANNLGADYFPRMIREEINAVLRDPSTNPKLWEQMKLELLANGNVKDTADAGEFLKGNVAKESIDDFFSNLELARVGRLPASWYETDFLKVMPRFVSKWAERSAQIEAFGQKIGDDGKDVFDRAIETTRNEAAQRYIEATRDHAYRVSRIDPSTRKIIGNITSATSALFLGNPYSTLRNLIGGIAQTTNQHGVMTSIRTLRETWRSIDDAKVSGALKADIADMIFQSDASGAVREFTNVALKLGGFNAAETFVRAHGYITAKTFLRSALDHIRTNPQSRRALQDRAFLQRYGFDAETLLAEDLKGPETDRFLRASVRESQGSYRYTQVPLFLNSPAGRFLAQYARWGTMAMRFHVRNTIAPAIQGELVRVREGGRIVEKRVRTIMPLLRSPLVAMSAGALTYAAREAFFGAERLDATWDEVFKTLDEDEQRGLELALSRMAADIVMGGSFGAISDYAGMLKEAATRGRYKNPVEPPAASIVKEIGVLGYKLAQQGQLTAEDYQQFASRVVSGYRYGKAVVYNFADAFGMDIRGAREFRADSDKRFTRAAGNRFAEESGLDIPAFNSGGLPTVNENTPFYNQLEDALLTGDAYEASRLVERELASLTGKKKAARATAIKTSIIGRQPLKPGGRSSQEIQAEFVEWSRRRLDLTEQRRMFELQRRYLDTALHAQLLTPESHASRTRHLPRVSPLED